MALPDCGLYRTTIPHPEQPNKVPSGRLVYFHNHSHAGKPMVLLPQSNAANTWTFAESGYLISKEAWVRSLQPVKAEGFYTTAEPFHTKTGLRVPPGQIVQLGYNRNAEPLVFFPRRDRDSNSLVFPSSGMKASASVYAGLKRIATRGPHEPSPTIN